MIKSAVKNAWGFNPKDSAIIVLDKTGKVKICERRKIV